jgi:hypothetical protein
MMRRYCRSPPPPEEELVFGIASAVYLANDAGGRMGQHFTDLNSLFSAATALADSAARLAMFRTHREMLGESVLFGIALQGNDLARQGEAIRTYEIGAEAAEAAELPRPRLKLVLQLAALVRRTATRPEAMTAAERAHAARCRAGRGRPPRRVGQP